MGEFANFALVPEQGAVPQMEQLDGQMQARISAMAARLDVRDSAAVMGFGAKAQKDMNAFTSIALNQMLREDVKPMEGVLETLGQSIRACSFAAQAKGLFARMFGGAPTLKDVRKAYEEAQPRIDGCADELTDRRVALMRDSALLERIYERNEVLYRELCSLIVVGEEAVRMAKARGEAAEDVARMERRVQDIRVSQLASTQLAAQIRMIQGSGELACQKLQTALEVTIPLWKSQMAAALGLARVNDSLTSARLMTQEAKAGIRRGAQETRTQREQLGKALEEDDRSRAEETAQALLSELEEIEASLDAQRNAKKNMA